jgi:hypothetical protein
MGKHRPEDEYADIMARRLLVARDLSYQAALLEQIELGTEHIESMRNQHPRYRGAVYTNAAPMPPKPKPAAREPWL